jgi:alpha-methylacyl-CoA racemase
MGYRPLDGVRVLDISRLYPGALATKRLADMGADVVKVEEPGRGDYIRTIPPLVDGKGVLHVLLDPGKRSIALDLKKPEGLDTFLSLVAVTDIVVESARPGRYLEMGIDFRELRRRRPELVVCSVSGFGQTGPLAPLASHGMNMDALSGTLILADWKGRKRFISLGFSIGVEVGALNAAFAIAAAVYGAKTRGQGVWIDASCWDGALEAQRMPIGAHVAIGEPLGPKEPRPLYDLYETSDGKLMLFCAIERKFWESFCRGVGRPDLIGRWEGADVDFGDASLRSDLEEIFVQRSAAQWEKHFFDWDIPGSVVLPIGEVLAHPHAAARGLVRGDGGPLVASPLRWHDLGVRPGDDAPPPPELGEHTDEVLHQWLEGKG